MLAEHSLDLWSVQHTDVSLILLCEYDVGYKSVGLLCQGRFLTSLSQNAKCPSILHRGCYKYIVQEGNLPGSLVPVSRRGQRQPQRSHVGQRGL